MLYILISQHYSKKSDGCHVEKEICSSSLDSIYELDFMNGKEKPAIIISSDILILSFIHGFPWLSPVLSAEMLFAPLQGSTKSHLQKSFDCQLLFLSHAEVFHQVTFSHLFPLSLLCIFTYTYTSLLLSPELFYFLAFYALSWGFYP